MKLVNDASDQYIDFQNAGKINDFDNEKSPSVIYSQEIKYDLGSKSDENSFSTIDFDEASFGSSPKEDTTYDFFEQSRSEQGSSENPTRENSMSFWDSDDFSEDPSEFYHPVSYPEDDDVGDESSSYFESMQSVENIDQAMAEVEKILAEDPALLMGLLSSVDYDTFIHTIQEYYSEQIKVLELLLANAEKLYERLLDYPSELMDYTNNITYYENQINSEIENARIHLMAEDPEFAAMDYEQQVEYVREHDQKVKNAIENYNQYRDFFNQKVVNEYGDLGITTVEDFFHELNKMPSNIRQIKQAIATLTSIKSSVPYDYLPYLNDYQNYEYDSEVSEDEAISVVSEDFLPILSDKNHPSREMILEEARNGLTFLFEGNYTKYHEKYPDVSPLEYIKMLMVYDPNAFNIYNIEGIDLETWEALLAIITLEKYDVDLGKKYSYIFQTQGAEAAILFLKTCRYQINDYMGQIQAKEFLDSLHDKDGETALKAILNVLGISLQGLADGTTTFNEGLGYAFESLLTLLGQHAENRIMSPEEYKRMYILMALMPESDRKKYGKIIVGEDGNKYSSSSIVDFTKEYSGVLLNYFYEFNQGIGNMVPYVLLGAINPYLGMGALGVSAGGNAYHSAMVDGKSLVQALFYELFTGVSEPLTEAFLGGMPFISNTKVSSLKSFFAAMARETTQESLQGALDLLYRAAFMDEPLPDIDDVDGWLKVFGDIGKQGIYGGLTAGVFNFPHLVAAIHNQHRVNTFINERRVSPDQQRKAIDTIRESDPSLKRLTDNEIKALFPNEFEAMVLLLDDKNLCNFLKLVQTMIPVDQRGEYNIDLLVEQLLSGNVDPKLLEFVRSKLPEFFVRGSQMFEELYKLIPLDDYDPSVPFDQILLHKIKEGDFSDFNRFSEMFEFVLLMSKKLGNSLLQFDERVERRLLNSQQWLPEDVREKIPQYQELYDSFLQSNGRLFLDSNGDMITSLEELAELIQNSTGEEAARYRFMYQLMDYYRLTFDGKLYDDLYVSRLSQLLELQNRLDEIQKNDTLTAEEQNELDSIQQEMAQLFFYVHETDINVVREKHDRIEWFKAEQKRLTKELMVKYRAYVQKRFSDATPEEQAMMEELIDYWFSDDAIDRSNHNLVIDIYNMLHNLRDYSSFSEFLGRFKNALRTVVGITDVALKFEQSEDQSMFTLLDLIRRELMKVDTDEDHGQVEDEYRQRNLHSHGDRFFSSTPDYRDVPARMQELSLYFDEVLQETNPEEYIKKAGYLWYQFMLIHPYGDGNGRTGRYLLNILFERMGIHSESLYASTAERDQFLLALDQYYFRRPPDIEGLQNEFYRFVKERGYYVKK